MDQIFYGSVYVVVLLVPLMARTRHDLRLFSSRALLAMVIVFPLYLAVPLISPPRPFAAGALWRDWLDLDRSHDSAAAAFPSYQVVWAFIAAETLARTPWQKRLWRAWALLVSASCITAGMHALVMWLPVFWWPQQSFGWIGSGLSCANLRKPLPTPGENGALDPDV